MDLPKPPEDQELRNIIDKLAQFVARNGLEFEQMTKNKQKDNAKFAFLFGGEYFNYYQYKVTTEQAILKQKQKVMEQQALVQHTITQQSIQSAPWQHHVQQQQIQEQIQQSERNLAAQNQMLIQQQQVQIDEAIRKAQDEKLQALAKEVDIDLQVCDKIMQPIIDSCTKDSISAGKGWIFNHATSPKHCEVITRYLLKRVTTLGTSFELKLHLVYLINDVLHHCVRKNADDLKKALEVMVVPVFCTTSLGASDEQQQKLSKLLKLWESNNYFESSVLEQLKNPSASLAAYQTNLITSHASVITPITTAIQNQYAVLQKQHQDFVAHITGQIQHPEQPFSGISSQTPVPMAVQHPSAVTENNIPTSLSISSNPLTPNSMDSSVEMTSPTSAGSSSTTVSSAPPPFVQPPPSFPPNFSHPPPNFTHPPPGFMPNFNQPPPNFQQPPPGLPPPFAPAEIPGLPLPDLSKPPPCFPVRLPPPHQPPVIDLNDPNLMPSVPYYELPAGLMAPLVKLEEAEYRPLDPDEIRLPPPAPPSERLLAAVELFYTPPSHERPRNSEGWEQLGLYEFFKAKSQAKKRKEEELKEIKGQSSPRHRSRSRSQSRERILRSKSKSPPLMKRRYNEHRSKSRSKSRSRSRSKSVSPLPYKRSSRSRSRSISPSKPILSRSPSRSRSRSMSPPHSRKRSVSRSPTPPSFFGGNYPSTNIDRRLDESNKGHQLLKKMGWGGQGLGAAEQGIHDPIQAGDIRDRQDQYKGIGINLNDPFETFRKSKGQAFINRMRARAEEKMNH